MSVNPWFEGPTGKVLRVFDPTWEPDRRSAGRIRLYVTRSSSDPCGAADPRLLERLRQEPDGAPDPLVQTGTYALYFALAAVLSGMFLRVMTTSDDDTSGISLTASNAEFVRAAFSVVQKISIVGLVVIALVTAVIMVRRQVEQRSVSDARVNILERSEQLKVTYGPGKRALALFRASAAMSGRTELWANGAVAASWDRQVLERMWAVARREAARSSCRAEIDAMVRNLRTVKGDSPLAADVRSKGEARLAELRGEHDAHGIAVSALLDDWAETVDALNEAADNVAAARAMSVLHDDLDRALGRPVAHPELLAATESVLTGAHLTGPDARARTTAYVNAYREL